MRVVFVHGACVRDGSWWWHRTAERLQAYGITSTSPALPSCGETGLPVGTDGPGLSQDVAAVRQILQQEPEPTVVVAHSYGGIVVAEAAKHLATVNHLLFISSYLPEVGQSLSDFGDDAPAPFLEIDPSSGTFGVRADMLTDTFLQDCPPDVQSQATGHLARQSVQVTSQLVGSASWQDLPTTYLVCTKDHGTPAERQRAFARKANNVIELDAGHHPFLSQPEQVADLLLSLG